MIDDKKEYIRKKITENEQTIQELIPEYMTDTEILCWIQALMSTMSSLSYLVGAEKEDVLDSVSGLLDCVYEYHSKIEVMKVH